MLNKGVVTLDKYDLMSRSKEELITLVGKLMGKLTEKERLEFVSKWISPKAALEEANEYDENSFTKKVELFCQECLNGKYYVEPDYEQDYNYYDDDGVYDYSESEWAEIFTEFLKLAVMYARDKKYDVSFYAFDQLLNCLNEAECDENILGTENPMDYLESDWSEIFSEYFISMKNHLSDEKQLAVKAVNTWISFGKICTDGILTSVTEIKYVEESIRKNIMDHLNRWSLQHQLYELLKKLYLKIGLEFDEIGIAKSLVRYNPNFLNDVAQGYMSLKMWDMAIQILKDALVEVKDEKVITEINMKLVDCYVNLTMFNEAYHVAVEMFMKNNSHELYLKARNIAIKMDVLEIFIDNMESYTQSNGNYNSTETLLRILSFEGFTLKLIDTALKSEGYLRHDHLKYTAKSLIYRVLVSEKNISPNLREFLESVEDDKITGIIDMVSIPLTFQDKQVLLHSAIKMLKEMAQFHINAAKRTRYTRAADYIAVIRDVSIYMNELDSFNQYYTKILKENSRRPALKDEMKKKLQ